LSQCSILAPISGKIVELNSKILDKPELINKEPYGDGWICIIKPEDPKMLHKSLILFQDYNRLLASAEKSPFKIL